jgi:hypothetical protein
VFHLSHHHHHKEKAKINSEAERVMAEYYEMAEPTTDLTKEESASVLARVRDMLRPNPAIASPLYASSVTEKQKRLNLRGGSSAYSSHFGSSVPPESVSDKDRVTGRQTSGSQDDKPNYNELVAMRARLMRAVPNYFLSHNMMHSC